MSEPVPASHGRRAFATPTRTCPPVTKRECAQPLMTLEVPGFRLRETAYAAAAIVPTQPYTWATLCLAVEGGYQMDWGPAGLFCGPASLVFHPPGQVYGAQISDQGSRCLTVDIDPAVLLSAANTLPDFERLSAPRRMSPHWLAFQLRRELELGDDLSATAVASIVIALLAELGCRPAVQARSMPPPWLKRVQEHIDDEFRSHHTLESLAQTAGVHHVHLAREFHRRLGCTVGHYIRQRRVEFACRRLTGSGAPLAEIAFEAGFADQSHFTNTFRQLVGMTPGVFRTRFAEQPRRLSA